MSLYWRPVMKYFTDTRSTYHQRVNIRVIHKRRCRRGSILFSAECERVNRRIASYHYTLRERLRRRRIASGSLPPPQLRRKRIVLVCSAYFLLSRPSSRSVLTVTDCLCLDVVDVIYVREQGHEPENRT